MKLVTSDQMRAIDHAAINDFGIPSIVLMENAALRIADKIAEIYGSARTFAVLAGAGNNGGDGIAVVRYLISNYGWTGTIWDCKESGAKTTAERDTNIAIAQKMQISIKEVRMSDFENDLREVDVVIDALLGSGARGDLRPMVASLCDMIAKCAHGNTVSIDIPSWIDSDTGAVKHEHAFASLVVTIGRSKPGLYTEPAVSVYDRLELVELAYPPLIFESAQTTYYLTDSADVARLLPGREPKRDANKSTYGAVGIFAGSLGFAGAPTLACHGAVRAGAGLVTLAVPEGLLDVMMARAPDTVMTRGFAQTSNRGFSVEALSDALQFAEKLDAIGIGPGIGSTDASTRDFVAAFVQRCPKPLVIDADALNCLSHLPDNGASITRSRIAATLFTPHPGEMGRLMGLSTKDVQNNRLETVQNAAKKFGCVVLLKGNRTLIASPDGKVAINVTGNAGMASGGMGDVLTGVATAFLAQIRDPFWAASVAAFVHGMAGDIAAQIIGFAGITANDLAENLPGAISQCRNGNNQYV